MNFRKFFPVCNDTLNYLYKFCFAACRCCYRAFYRLMMTTKAGCVLRPFQLCLFLLISFSLVYLVFDAYSVYKIPSRLLPRKTERDRNHDYSIWPVYRHYNSNAVSIWGWYHFCFFCCVCQNSFVCIYINKSTAQ